MNYLSLDLEMTGLSENLQILEIGAIYVENGLEVLQFNCLVDHDTIVGEPFALNMNSAILAELGKPTGKRTIYSLEEARSKFLQFLTSIPEKRITVAGKNVAGFDLPFLARSGFDTSKFSHRVLDVGSLWMPDFNRIPNLDEINKKLDRNKVSHTAIEDCKDVIAAVEAKRSKGV